jgi:hypothetical protein
VDEVVRKAKAQVTIEFVLIFVTMVFLILGMLWLWKWSSDNIILRQIRYNADRVRAGTSDTAGNPEKPYDSGVVPEEQPFYIK